MDVYLRVRRAMMVDGMSIREVSRVFDLHWDTVRKILAYSAPPRYRRQTPPRCPKLEPFTGIIDHILVDDLRRPSRRRVQWPCPAQRRLAWGRSFRTAANPSSVKRSLTRFTVPRSLAGKPLARFRATPSRRITGLTGIIIGDYPLTSRTERTDYESFR